MRNGLYLSVCSLVTLSTGAMQAFCQNNQVRNMEEKTIPAESVDLGGEWLMKDFAEGVGEKLRVYEPGKAPDCTMKCEVPGTVRNALLRAAQIPDPYYGYDNEKSRWVEGKEWWFFRKFVVPESERGKFASIKFDGTSYSGDCWINGRKVGEFKGMLNPATFDVTAVLNYGAENDIAVRLQAPPDAFKNVMKFGVSWHTPRDQVYSIAQCMYGWDWCAHMFPVGIWQPVRLKFTGPVRIADPYIRSRVASAKSATCSIEIDLSNVSERAVTAECSGYIAEKESEKIAGRFSKAVSLLPGEVKTQSFELKVNDPQLWWPNGMGKPNLYMLHADVSLDGSKSDSLSAQFGIRELKMVDNQDIGTFLKTMKKQVGSQYKLGKAVGAYPWTFEINGRKMFAKGANWIPVDQMLRLTKYRYKRLLELFRDAHLNLLRVWGGGLYETDDFYNLCDEYGILTWQEFLSNRNFSKIDLNSFLDGVRSAVLRLRNHPSLTFWCGGNEFDPDDKGSRTVIDSLADLLNKLDPQREFHRASPYKGDDHSWGVWHGMEPYTAYREVRPFRSEAGLNAPPVWEDLVKFAPEKYLWPPDSVFVEYRGQQNLQFKHLRTMMRYVGEFGKPANMKELVTRMQLYQAIGNEFDMEYCRENKFRNSGILIWQYDDIWPCFSWSMVDWYGIPKPSYYFIKRAARPVHISADYSSYLWKAGQTFRANVYLLNDTQLPVKGYKYYAKLIDCSGRILVEQSGPAATPENTSTKIGAISYRIPASMKGKTFFVSVELEGDSGEIISDAIYPIAVGRNGDLQDYVGILSGINDMPAVHLEVKSEMGQAVVSGDGRAGCALRITNPTSHLAFFIRTRLLEESDSLHTVYSDNYVSLLPGETKTVSVELDGRSYSGFPREIHFEVSGINCPKQSVGIEVKGR